MALEITKKQALENWNTFLEESSNRSSKHPYNIFSNEEKFNQIKSLLIADTNMTQIKKKAHTSKAVVDKVAAYLRETGELN